MKNRLVVFIVGLLAGIAIVMAFDVGIKKLLQPIRDLYSNIRKINSTQDKISQRLDSIQGKMKGDAKNNTVIAKTQNKAVVAQYTPVLKRDSVIAKKQDDNIDSSDDGTIALQNKDSNVVVMTNQLVSVKSVAVSTLDSLSNSGRINHRSDSMIAAMSNVNEEQDPHYYRIEFWQSPLNFKGYKMSKGKIILYGINSNTDTRLVKWDDGYYLMTNQVVYKVEYTDDYKPFEKVMDKTVLKKITL